MTTKFPKSWVAANAALSKLVAAKEAQVTKDAMVTARIDMSAEVAGQGKCPECKKDMEVVFAGNQRVWACQADRITLPVPNGYEG